MTASQFRRSTPDRHQLGRKWICAALLIGSGLTAPLGIGSTAARADWPHAGMATEWNRWGRRLGIGTSDGYHAARPRPANRNADLPPHPQWVNQTSTQYSYAVIQPPFQSGVQSAAGTPPPVDAREEVLPAPMPDTAPAVSPSATSPSDAEEPSRSDSDISVLENDATPEQTQPSVPPSKAPSEPPAAPELPVPELPVPELPVPELPVPELPVPELPVPELPVPELPVPEAPVPELPVPELPVPEVPVPEAPVPEVPVEAESSLLDAEDFSPADARESKPRLPPGPDPLENMGPEPRGAAIRRLPRPTRLTHLPQPARSRLVRLPAPRD